MRELSLHIMDIIQNSIRADGKLINIEINEDKENNLMKIIIEDDGVGMDDEMLENVKNPFATTRTTRKVGMGISLFEAACRRCEGSLNIESQLEKGTKVTATMEYNHIDRAPMGRIDETISCMFLYDYIDFVYNHRVNEKKFTLDSREVKEKVNGDDLNNAVIITWLKEYIRENLILIGAELF